MKSACSWLAPSRPYLTPGSVTASSGMNSSTLTDHLPRLNDVGSISAETVTVRSRFSREISNSPCRTTLRQPTRTALRLHSACESACSRDRQPSAFLDRIAHHDSQLVLAALNALRLLTVESLANLAAQRRHRQPQGLGLGLDLQLDLIAAGSRRVDDVEYALVVRQFDASSAAASPACS